MTKHFCAFPMWIHKRMMQMPSSVKEVRLQTCAPASSIKSSKHSSQQPVMAYSLAPASLYQRLQQAALCEHATQPWMAMVSLTRKMLLSSSFTWCRTFPSTWTSMALMAARRSHARCEWNPAACSTHCGQHTLSLYIYIYISCIPSCVVQPC